MDKINYTVIIIILITIIAGFNCSIYHNSNIQDNSKLNVISIAPESLQLIGSTEYGTVIKSGHYGNHNGTQKIAFIVGVHPLEIDSHRALATAILGLNMSLNSCFYIYSVDVTKDRTSYTNGRMNGQLLAYKFAVPDIIQNHFDLAVDVHSNRGGNFQKKNFVYVPKDDIKSLSVANTLKDKLSWIVYYTPPYEAGPRSPSYVTIPLIDSGNPAVIYESYRYEPYYVTFIHAVDLIKEIDKLKLV